MAKQTTVTITCDICGDSKDVRTRSFGLDGRVLEIDLCGKDSRSLEKVAQEFIAHARRVGRTPKAAGRRTTRDRQHSAAVREWARQQGMELNDRGRIPADVERKYAAAH